VWQWRSHAHAAFGARGFGAAMNRYSFAFEASFACPEIRYWWSVDSSFAWRPSPPRSAFISSSFG
jgi:hypothetical protein